MDRYATLAEYAAAKARIFRGDGTMILNADDPVVLAMGLPGRSTVRFGANPPASDIDYGLVSHGGEIWETATPVPGRHRRFHSTLKPKNVTISIYPDNSLLVAKNLF